MISLLVSKLNNLNIQNSSENSISVLNIQNEIHNSLKTTKKKLPPKSLQYHKDTKHWSTRLSNKEIKMQLLVDNNNSENSQIIITSSENNREKNNIIFLSLMNHIDIDPKNQKNYVNDYGCIYINVKDYWQNFNNRDVNNCNINHEEWYELQYQLSSDEQYQQQNNSADLYIQYPITENFLFLLCVNGEYGIYQINCFCAEISFQEQYQLVPKSQLLNNNQIFSEIVNHNKKNIGIAKFKINNIDIKNNLYFQHHNQQTHDITIPFNCRIFEIAEIDIQDNNKIDEYYINIENNNYALYKLFFYLHGNEIHIPYRKYQNSYIIIINEKKESIIIYQNEKKEIAAIKIWTIFKDQNNKIVMELLQQQMRQLLSLVEQEKTQQQQKIQNIKSQIETQHNTIVNFEDIASMQQDQILYLQEPTELSTTIKDCASRKSIIKSFQKKNQQSLNNALQETTNLIIKEKQISQNIKNCRNARIPKCQKLLKIFKLMIILIVFLFLIIIILFFSVRDMEAIITKNNKMNDINNTNNNYNNTSNNNNDINIKDNNTNNDNDQ